jgi:hypothetical protein
VSVSVRVTMFRAVVGTAEIWENRNAYALSTVAPAHELVIDIIVFILILIDYRH